uniref:Xylulose kinase-1 n=1 Tax=Tanacetum cinerariifolium TaxID=118510 RepID=A0A699HRV1_TANCI|nr:hypothetical protein [Tanacetum cinerariifolium]
MLENSGISSLALYGGSGDGYGSLPTNFGVVAGQELVLFRVTYIFIDGWFESFTLINSRILPLIIQTLPSISPFLSSIIMAPLTFADTHNMIVFLTKSDASEGFDQIVDFLNVHTIQYALMVNPTIYVLCIKQFWGSVSIKKSNDVMKLQALIDRKKRRQDCSSFIDYQAQAKGQEVGKEEENQAFRIKEIKEDANEDVTPVDVDVEVEMDANIQGRMADDEAEPVEVEELIEVVTAAKLMTDVVTTTTRITTAAQVLKTSASRRRRGVVIQDPEETAAASIDIDEAFARHLEAEVNANINWDDARKNMMIYLKNMAGLKMDFFKGMTYSDIRPIFEKHYNSIQAFLEKGEEEVIVQEEGSKRKGENLKQETTKRQRIEEEAEELKRHLQIVVNDDDDVFTKATPLASKVPVVDYQILHENNKPYYKIIKADGTHKLFLSFITLLKSFDRDDMETLWNLVKERFESTEPNNFSYDFLLNILKIMFGKPNVEANIWRDQKSRYELAKSLRVMSSPNHPTSDIEDAFSSNSPNYTPASSDYSLASPRNTPSESLNNSYGLVPIALPTLSLSHDDPYMKVMHAYDAIILPQVLISPPVIMPPSSMLSPIFNPQEYFIPEELLPPKEQFSYLTSSSTDLFNPF